MWAAARFGRRIELRPRWPLPISPPARPPSRPRPRHAAAHRRAVARARAGDRLWTRAVDRTGAAAPDVVRAGRYAIVLFVFGAQRGIELVYSARNERLIQRRQPDAPQAGRSVFQWIALINVGLFTLPAVERALRRRPPPAPVAA